VRRGSRRLRSEDRRRAAFYYVRTRNNELLPFKRKTKRNERNEIYCHVKSENANGWISISSVRRPRAQRGRHGPRRPRPGGRYDHRCYYVRARGGRLARAYAGIRVLRTCRNGRDVPTTTALSLLPLVAFVFGARRFFRPAKTCEPRNLKTLVTRVRSDEDGTAARDCRGRGTRAASDVATSRATRVHAYEPLRHLLRGMHRARDRVARVAQGIKIIARRPGRKNTDSTALGAGPE